MINEIAKAKKIFSYFWSKILNYMFTNSNYFETRVDPIAIKFGLVCIRSKLFFLQT